MREIKFRGKDENDNWIIGYYLEVEYCDGEGRRSCIKVDGCGPVSIVPETVCQFTGLKDKNGNDIYEGDILLLSRGGGIMPVVFLEKASSFCLSIDKERDMMWFETDLLNGYYEIIGNIHDNPELLKAK